jgi:hypothetical protein
MFIKFNHVCKSENILRGQTSLEETKKVCRRLKKSLTFRTFWFFFFNSPAFLFSYRVRNIRRVIRNATSARHRYTTTIRHGSFLDRPYQISPLRPQPHARSIFLKANSATTHEILLHEINCLRVALANCIVLCECITQCHVEFLGNILLVNVC